MTKTLWGVVIGGIIGSITPLFSSLLDIYKYRKEHRLNFLKEIRDKREKLFDEITIGIKRSLEENKYDLKMVASLFELCPTKVENEFLEMISDEKFTAYKKRTYYLNILIAMKNHLAELDKKVEDAC